VRDRRDRETRNCQNPTPICTLMRQTYANLGYLGMARSEVYANLGYPGGGRGGREGAADRRDRA
jgi:hypothetical protein